MKPISGAKISQLFTETENFGNKNLEITQKNECPTILGSLIV